MAKSITFTDILPPTNLTGVVSTGGTLLANTTHYIVVIACMDNGTYSGSINGGKSLGSNEAVITTTTTDKQITLTWNYPVGGCVSYRIAIGSISGGYATYLNATPKDVTINSGGTCTFLVSGISYASNAYYQNTSHGYLNLAGSASNDPFNISALYNLCVAAGLTVIKKYNENTYCIDTYMYGQDGGYWVDERQTIIINDGFYAYNTSNFRFGKKVGVITSNGCHLIFQTFFIHSITFGTLNAFKTTFDYVFDYNPFYIDFGGISPVYLNFYYGTIEDSQANKIRSFAPVVAAYCTIRNFIATGYDVGFGTGSATFENVTGMGGSRPFQVAGSNVMRCKNFVSIGNSYTILVIGTNNQITMVNTVVDPTTYSNTYACGGTWIKEYITYNLTVYKNDGATPISGASVKIWDVANNLICNTITNASGVIAEQELLYRQVDYDNGSPSIRTITAKAPHKMVITASGYETYTQYTAITEGKAIQHVVALKPVTRTRYTIEGKPLRALLPENGSSSKLIEI